MSNPKSERDNQQATPESRHPQLTYREWEDAVDGKDSRCLGCDRLDKDGICSPFFGHYIQEYDHELEAVNDNKGIEVNPEQFDIVFIGESPGGNKTGKNNTLSTNKRVWKNYQEMEQTAGEAINPEDYPDEEELPEKPRIKHDTNIQPFDRSSGIFGDLRPFFLALRDEFEQYPDTYYTNAIKCSNKWETGSSDVNFDELENIDDELEKIDDENGFDKCKEYLISELEAVQPDVILVFSAGPGHIHRVLSLLSSEVEKSQEDDNVRGYVFQQRFGYDDNESVLKTEETPLRVFNTDKLSFNCSIYVSYHFSRGFGGSSNWIFDQLNERHSTGTKKKGPFAREFAKEAKESIQE